MHKRYNIIIRFFHLCLFIYVLFRANLLSFVHDEGLSYAIIKGDQETAMTANDHYLNTFLMEWFGNIFGENEFALRLPNVIAFGFYILGCGRILDKTRSVWLYIFGNALLLLNPFVLDFFSLARGYGLSLAFLIWSLYFLLRNGVHHPNYTSLVKDFSFAITLAGIGCLANFSLINYLIAAVLIFLYKYLVFIKVNGRQYLQKHLLFLGIAATAMIPSFIVMQRLLFLSEKGQLYYGTSFIGESMDSLIIESLYFNTFPQAVYIKYIIVGLFFLGIASLIRRRDFNSKFCLIVSLIAILIVGLLLEYYLFDAKFPLSRTSLLFIPIFGLFTYYFALHILSYYRVNRRIAIPSAALTSTIVIVHFISSANFHTTLTWKYDAHTRDIMKIVGSQSKNKEIKQTISNDWLYSPAINYYIVSRKLNVKLANRNGVSPETNFIYKHGDVADVPNFVKLINYDDTATVLLQKR